MEAYEEEGPMAEEEEGEVGPIPVQKLEVREDVGSVANDRRRGVTNDDVRGTGSVIDVIRTGKHKDGTKGRCREADSVQAGARLAGKKRLTTDESVALVSSSRWELEPQM